MTLFYTDCPGKGIINTFISRSSLSLKAGEGEGACAAHGVKLILHRKPDESVFIQLWGSANFPRCPRPYQVRVYFPVSSEKAPGSFFASFYTSVDVNFPNMMSWKQRIKWNSVRKIANGACTKQAKSVTWIWAHCVSLTTDPVCFLGGFSPLKPSAGTQRSLVQPSYTHISVQRKARLNAALVLGFPCLEPRIYQSASLSAFVLGVICSRTWWKVKENMTFCSFVLLAHKLTRLKDGFMIVIVI